MSNPVARKPGFSFDAAVRVLAVAAFINWFVFFGVSFHFGGDAMGTLPSRDGFVLKSHGKRTAVTESVWQFSLVYPYCTLMLTPAIFFLFGARQGALSSVKPAKRWFIVIFLSLWALGWYTSITNSFIKSVKDYRSLKLRATQPTAEQP